jgi:ketosteroid isomerase-like protein
MGGSFAPRILGKSEVVPPDPVPANHFPKSTLGDSTVRIFGDTAVLMGNVEMRVEQKSEMIRITTVFQKHGEDWQVIAIHVLKAQA